MIFLSILTGLAVGLLLLPALSDLLSIGHLRRERRPLPAPARYPRLLFLVPAHDEELLIASCVRSLLDQRYPADSLRVVVIADNCRDRTAEIARASGAEVLERETADRRGKPWAISWALERISPPEYDALIVVDADTTVAPDFGARVAEQDAVPDQAFQAFLGVRNPDESAMTRMATVLATVTHRLAYPLKAEAGLNVPLVGNGMVFGSRVLAQHGWHAFGICEDWEMYALLTEAGVRIRSLRRAHVYAQEEASCDRSYTQRQRWTAGKLTVFGRIGPRILRSRHVGLRQKIDALGELAAPGPALHLAIVLGLGVGLLLLRPPGALAIAACLVASLVRIAIYAVVALTLQPSPVRTARAFAFLPLYTLWRVLTALRSLHMVGDKPWVRTARHSS